MSGLTYPCPEYGEISINDLKNRFREKMAGVIDSLASIEIVAPEDGEPAVLFAHRVIKDGFHEPETELALLSDLRKETEIPVFYGYFITPQAEIAGFLIADTPYTQQNIYSLLADVLHEASFFGPNQEYLEEEIKKLEKSEEDVKSGNYYTSEEVEQHLKDEFGLEDERDPETEEEEKQRRSASEKEYEYCRMTAAREVEAIRKMLKED